MSKVTVVVPVFNAGKYLSKCINSLISQTYDNLEIILVNDGSTDNSGKICDKFSLCDERVRVIHKHNEGVSSARNKGIDLATGQFVCFVDSDDYIDKNMIGDLFNKITIDASDLVISGHRSIYANKKMVEHRPLRFSGSIEDFLQRIEDYIDRESVQGPCAKLYKLAIIKEHGINFPHDMSYGEDTVFVYKYLSKCQNVLAISDCYYNYNRIDENSLSAVFREDKIYIFLKLYEELTAVLKSFNIDNDVMVERKICTSAIHCINGLYGQEYKNKRMQRIKNIETILADVRIYQSFLNRRKDNIRFLIISFLMGRNQFALIDKIFYLKELLRSIKPIRGINTGNLWLNAYTGDKV